MVRLLTSFSQQQNQNHPHQNTTTAKKPTLAFKAMVIGCQSFILVNQDIINAIALRG